MPDHETRRPLALPALALIAVAAAVVVVAPLVGAILAAPVLMALRSRLTHLGPVGDFRIALQSRKPVEPARDIERLDGHLATPSLQAIAVVLDGTAK